MKSVEVRYERYKKPQCFEAQFAEKTSGSFGIVHKTIHGEPHVLIKQRNAKGSCPLQFDLPGGRFDPLLDISSIDTCRRELKEEIGLQFPAECFSRIGEPLFLPTMKEGLILKIDVAQAFFVNASVNENEIKLTEECVSFQFVSPWSVLDFDVVGLDRENRTLGRTPIMIFDGLSVLAEPLKRISLREAKKLVFDKQERSYLRGYFLLDDGNYLGKVVKKGKKDDPDEVEVYHRLNPFEPNGRFQGRLG